MWMCLQVLDAGKIDAYDEPYTLLQNPDGIFYKMVQQTGKLEAAALLEAAKQVRFILILKCYEKPRFLFGDDVFSGLQEKQLSQHIKRTRGNSRR